MAVELPGRDHLELHGGFGRPMPILADNPRMHVFWHMAQRRNLTNVIKVLQDRLVRGAGAARRWR